MVGSRLVASPFRFVWYSSIFLVYLVLGSCRKAACPRAELINPTASKGQSYVVLKSNTKSTILSNPFLEVSVGLGKESRIRQGVGDLIHDIGKSGV